MLVYFLALFQGTAPVPVTVSRWSLVEELRIDGEAAALSAIGHVRVASNGTISVAQHQDSKVKFFSPIGKLIGQFGRKGEGPGEFRDFPFFGGFLGDRMWLLDGQGGQITFLTQDFKFLRGLVADKKLLKHPSGAALRPLKLGGVLFPTIDGELVYRIPMGVFPQDKFWVDLANGADVLLVRVSENGKYLGRVATLKTDESCFLAPNLSLPQSYFCGDARVSPTPDGSKIFILQSLQAFPGQPDRFRVTSLSLRGDTLFTRWLKVAPSPIPKTVIDSVRSRMVQDAAPARVEAWRTVKFPTHYAPADRILTGIDGTVWVRLARTAQGWPWLGLGAKGETLGMVVLADRLTPQAVSKTNLWAVDTDDEGVESIVRFRIGAR